MDENLLISERLRRLDVSLTVQPGKLDTVVRRVERSRRRHRVATYVLTAGSLAVVAVIGFGVADIMEPTNSAPEAGSVPRAEPSPSPVSVTPPDQAWRAATARYRDQLFSVAGRSDSLVGLKIDDSQHALLLYGVGTPNDEISDLLGQAPSGTSARWNMVPFTTDELDGAMQKVMAEGGVISGASYGSDFASIKAYYWPADVDTARELQERLGALVAPVPVVVGAQAPADTSPLVGSD